MSAEGGAVSRRRSAFLNFGKMFGLSSWTHHGSVGMSSLLLAGMLLTRWNTFRDPDEDQNLTTTIILISKLIKELDLYSTPSELTVNEDIPGDPG